MPLFARLLVSAMLIFTTLPVSADEAVMLKAGFMSLDADGTFGASGSGLAGTSINVDSNLGLGRSNNVTLEGAVQFGDFRWSLNYYPLNFSGDSTLNIPVNYNGQTYNLNDSVHAKLQADVFDAAVTWYLINMDDMPSRLQLGIEFAVKTVNAKSTLTDNTLGITQSVSTTLPIPTLGARGRIALADYIGLTGRAGYLAYGGNHFLDSEVQLEFSPLPTLGMYAGYRYIDLKVDHSNVLVDATFSGPFVGGLFRF